MNEMKGYITKMYQEMLCGAIEDMASDRSDELERDFPGFLRVANEYKNHLYDYEEDSKYALACDIIDFMHLVDPWGFGCEDPKCAREVMEEIRDGVPHWMRELQVSLCDDPELLEELEDLIERIMRR